MNRYKEALEDIRESLKIDKTFVKVDTFFFIIN